MKIDKYNLLSNFVTFSEKLAIKDRTIGYYVLELRSVSGIVHLVIFNYI